MGGKKNKKPHSVDSGQPSAITAGLDSLSLTDTSTGPPPAVPAVAIRDAPEIDWVLADYNKSISPPDHKGYPPGNRVRPGADIINQLVKFKDKLEYPVRDGLRADTGATVLTNHFEVSIDPSAQFWEYRITGIAENEKRAMKKRIMDTVIQEVQFLRDNQKSFATDYNGTIIAWKNLHSLATGPKISSTDPLKPDLREEWRLVDVLDRNVTLYLNLRLIGLVDVPAFQSYTNSTHSDPSKYDPEPTKNALNIIVTKCFENPGNIIQLNAHKFFIAHAMQDLQARGDQVWPLRALRGYYYTITPGMGKILLNVNPATSAFWNPCYVSQVLQDGLGTFGGDQYALKGVQVYISYERGRDAKGGTSSLNDQHNRIKRIRGFGKPLNVQTFKLPTKDEQGKITYTKTTVADYLERTYRLRLKNRNLPAVDLSLTGEPSWFAPEYLSILPNQIWARIIPDAVAVDFHRLACVSPGATRARIEKEGLAQLERNAVAFAPGSNTNAKLASLVKCPLIRINPVMMQIPASRLPQVTITYKQDTGKWQRFGRWNLDNRKFLEGSRESVKWKLIQGVGVTNQAVTNFIAQFNEQLTATGVCPVGMAAHIGQRPVVLAKDSETDLRAALNSLYEDNHQQGIPRIVVLLLKTKDTQVYSSFKYLTDKIFNFHAICATEAKFRPRTGWGTTSHMQQYMANVAMKANLKVSGINHTASGVSDVLADILVIGADITHPGSGAIENCPSIAAVVGSVEKNGGLFRGEMSLQNNEDIVEHLEDAVSKLLRAWCRAHEKWPAGILYYRDGISKSQYKQFELTEIPAIHKAWTEYGKTISKQPPPLKLTTVIVTKRHNTRFFPSRAEDAFERNENCYPGTLVDSVVTDPYFSDFFLQSHSAIKGTARPCHYYVVNNGLGFTMSKLEDFTHALCHTYVRATLSVSYAPPAYYADRLCERGRCYLREWYNPSTAMKNAWAQHKRDAQDKVSSNRATTNTQANRPHRQRGHKKTDLEVKEERDDEREVAVRLGTKLAPEIKARFNARGLGGEAREQMIKNTMYWM